MQDLFNKRLLQLEVEYVQLTETKNLPLEISNGIIQRYKHPVLTAGHVPLNWRYDLNPQTNPYLMERIAVNAGFNAGSIKWK